VKMKGIQKMNMMLATAVIASMLITASLLTSPMGMANMFSALGSIQMPGMLDFAEAASGERNHEIDMTAVMLPNGQFAYELNKHIVKVGKEKTDLTSDYADDATIPGPTIILEEGDKVKIRLKNSIAGQDVGMLIQDLDDDKKQAATGKTVNYEFKADKAGTYLYQDQGSELVGLFGAIIVNSKDGTVESVVDGSSGEIEDVDLGDLEREYVLFMVGSTFWVSEIGDDGTQTPLWTNPMLGAVEGDLIRFHVLSIGHGHTFHLHAHRWVDPGTNAIIDTKLMDTPFDTHVFTVKAGDQVGPGDWQYHCHVFSHMEAGMHGIFRVESSGPAASVAGATPLNIHPVVASITGAPAPTSDAGLVTFEITDEPGRWFKNTLDISPVTKTKSLAVARVGDSVNFVMSQTNTVHTITSLLWPAGAEHMPFDEITSYDGGGIVPLHEPGLYVFTCKVHPYMFGAVIADDLDTQLELDSEGDPVLANADLGIGNVISEDGGLLLDLGTDITLVMDPTGSIPVTSDLAVRLLKTFFVATTPENWRDYRQATWNPSYPAVPVLAGPVPLVNLDAFLGYYFQETDAANTLFDPETPGVGQVWVDTQFELTKKKTKPGTATAVDTEEWEVSKKVALPNVNMNNPHNMWTDDDQKVIYQTEWFDNKLVTFNRETGKLVSQIEVGEAPSHVMTRTDTGDIHVALNGEEGVAEILKTTKPEQVERIIPMQDIGQSPTHPHAHWMSAEGDKMVTPNSFTGDTTLYGFDTEQIDAKPATGALPIATGMMPDSSKYYVANLLSSTISVIDMDTGVKLHDINLLQDYNPLALDLDKTTSADDAIQDDGDGILELGALPIQTPVSPDGKYMVTANTLSGTITIVDTSSDEIVSTLFCEAGCHGVQFGAKQGGGYYAYVSSKFANDLIVVDVDDSSPDNLTVVGKILLTDPSPSVSDDKIVGNDGHGGQGVLAIPNVYNGWVQNLPDEWTEKLSCEQRTPIDIDAINDCEA
jgi:DNA-binding beta-propeller fold protein YncE/plastocyanin